MKKLLYPTLLLLASCSVQEHPAELLPREVLLYPDVAGVTVPKNLAPLRFAVNDSCEMSQVQAIFQAGGEKCVIGEEQGQIAIEPEQWQKLCQAGDNVIVRIQAQQSGQWVEYLPFSIYLSDDKIDPYLSYRLIEPGYEVWGEMGLYQRNLETYEETAILENKQTEGGCMNCHTYNQHNPKQMLFHLRQACGGTYVVEGDKVEKLNTKTPETISALVYPSWHPSGRYVAFSTNTTKQAFHSTDKNRIEVFDKESDVVIYDVEKHVIFSCPQLKLPSAFETFPSFSPDGKTLYFCSADSLNVMVKYRDVHYSLCSIAFHPDSVAPFGSEVDTLYNARVEGGSISFPRVSPNGDYLMFTKSAYGNFSIWHKDADLYLLNLQTREISALDALNSVDVESFHSWSSNGRWVVFSSRREDGLYTRPFLAHIDAEGIVSKPVPVPQATVMHDTYLMKSYNLPEFMTGPVSLPDSFAKMAKEDPGTNVRYQ